MDMEKSFQILLAIIVMAYIFRRWVMFRSVQKDLAKHLSEGAIVIDVRSREEYSGGHYKNSINIPLQELAMKAKELDREKTILLCCASGARSGMAANILKNSGFKKVLNAGPWSGLK